MIRRAVLGVSIVALACGGSPRTAPAPAPKPEPNRPTPPPATAGARIEYHLRSPLTYEIVRYDSLFFLGEGSGIPQVTGRLAQITVRPDGSRLVITLDSVSGVLGPHLARSTIDSALEARWEAHLSPAGTGGQLQGNRSTVLQGQLGAGIRLLFPQLPKGGVKADDVWTDSTTYPIRLDAFEAEETALRSTRALRGNTTGGVRLEVSERLTRTGTATQGGRTMALRGAGGRQAVYELVAEGWVNFLRSSDSLDLQVTIPDGAQVIPVRWRSTIIARMRGIVPR